ncbi:aminotransferase class IV [Niabella yanshanensis]|uniref:branched-chain-amino-acid transaminase n=1 Tax=Niabella yanshanensis TaxID=577386 RepID=A0ABZ0W506_9BACT|nr:aminotransferase class IV [Niabella yanshanensis]WQD37634.1 aminotransferase class IV [Niabella yanshanensis]
MTARKICHNGTYKNESEPIIRAGNKSYRYGDGFFETLKVWKGAILFETYHQKRIEKSLDILQYARPAHFSITPIFSQVIQLCEKNGCVHAARVRLSFSHGNGGLFDGDDQLQYIIEAWPLEPANNHFNENGLVTGFFREIKKSCDSYANIKSASALLYTVAANYSRLHQWNDCIIWNQRENICETIIANLFWIKDNRIYTPALTEGCVDGVMRSFLIDQIGTVTETPCRTEDLLGADEVFLTNAIRGIRWVKSIEEVNYKGNLSRELHQQYIQSLF